MTAAATIVSVRSTKGRTVTHEPQQHTLSLSGLQLHYQTRGAGTPLLLIHGGISDAEASGHLATRLAATHQVITYDRRGLSRSQPTETASITLDQHAADIAHLLRAVADTPAHIVGTSIGALIGLHLASHHPELVDTLIAHEPPMAAVLTEPDTEHQLDTVTELARHDSHAAIQRLASLHEPSPPPEDGAQAAAPAGDVAANLAWFFTHDFPAVRADTLDSIDVAAAAREVTIVPTGGAAPPLRWEYRCAHRLARYLQRELVTLPGGHDGLTSHPFSTATALTQMLAPSGVQYA